MRSEFDAALVRIKRNFDTRFLHILCEFLDILCTLTVVNVRFSMLREYRPVRGDDRLKFDYS